MRPEPQKDDFGSHLVSFWGHVGLSFDGFGNLFGFIFQEYTLISQAIKRIQKIKQVSASFQMSKYSSGSAGFAERKQLVLYLVKVLSGNIPYKFANHPIR